VTGSWRWVPDVTAGLIVLVLGLVETAVGWRFNGLTIATLVVVTATATATGLSRRAPGAALVVAWCSVLLQVLGTALVEYSAPVMVSQIADLTVLYGAARWGRPVVVGLAAASVPLGGAVISTFLARGVAGAVAPITGVQWLLELGYQFGGHLRATAAGVGLLLLAVPWLLGLVLRGRESAVEAAYEVAEARASAAVEVAEARASAVVEVAEARASAVVAEAEARASAVTAASEVAEAKAAREQASELARLRADQARLARDVHDVVGHSLAVILAQAESAQFLPDEDPAALKATLVTVADSARASLRDIRRVLAATRDEVGADGLDGLLEGVRSGGREVLSTQSGTPAALDPERAEIAYRVLQEMLTNAIRHGRRDSAIVVRRDWSDHQLVIELRNGVAPDATASITPGQGLTGMADRLRAVEGRLAFVRRGEVFATTATIPCSRSAVASPSSPSAGASRSSPPAGASRSSPPAGASPSPPPTGTSPSSPPTGTSPSSPPAGTSPSSPSAAADPEVPR
jgi:signal transduction histidine kinase